VSLLPHFEQRSRAPHCGASSSAPAEALDPGRRCRARPGGGRRGTGD